MKFILKNIIKCDFSSPYLGPLLQSRGQKGFNSIIAVKEKDGTKRVVTRSASTAVFKRFVITLLNIMLIFTAVLTAMSHFPIIV
jgi:hypothetical protein